jgi:hypothetical protein
MTQKGRVRLIDLDFFMSYPCGQLRKKSDIIDNENFNRKAPETQ